MRVDDQSQTYAEKMNDKDEEIDFVRDQAKKQIDYTL